MEPCNLGELKMICQGIELQLRKKNPKQNLITSNHRCLKAVIANNIHCSFVVPEYLFPH